MPYCYASAYAVDFCCMHSLGVKPQRNAICTNCRAEPGPGTANANHENDYGRSTCPYRLIRNPGPCLSNIGKRISRTSAARPSNLILGSSVTAALAGWRVLTRRSLRKRDWVQRWSALTQQLPLPPLLCQAGFVPAGERQGGEPFDADRQIERVSPTLGHPVAPTWGPRQPSDHRSAANP